MNNLDKEILTVKDIQMYLGIGRAQAYELVKKKQFPIMQIGRSIRISRDNFLLWVQDPDYFLNKRSDKK